MAVAALGLLLFSIRLRFRSATDPDARKQKAEAGMPARFWVYAGFAFLYGIVETMNGNWAIALHGATSLGATITVAS